MNKIQDSEPIQDAKHSRSQSVLPPTEY